MTVEANAKSAEVLALYYVSEPFPRNIPLSKG